MSAEGSSLGDRIERGGPSIRHCGNCAPTAGNCVWRACLGNLVQTFVKHHADRLSLGRFGEDPSTILRDMEREVGIVFATVCPDFTLPGGSVPRREVSDPSADLGPATGLERRLRGEWEAPPA